MLFYGYNTVNQAMEISSVIIQLSKLSWNKTGIILEKANIGINANDEIQKHQASLCNSFHCFFENFFPLSTNYYVFNIVPLLLLTQLLWFSGKQLFFCNCKT